MKQHICKECGAVIPSWSIVNGKKVNLQHRHYCLICSPYGKRAKNRYGKRADSHQTGGNKYCPRCKRVLPPSSFYPRGKKENLGDLSAWCLECYREDAGQRNHNFKKRCVEYKGGKCQRCGYSRYIGALEFHHRDPSKKEFNINKRRHCVWTAKIEMELDKCDVYCSNCHREIHAEINGIFAREAQLEKRLTTDQEGGSSSLLTGATKVGVK